MAKVNIAGIDKAVLVKALYDRAQSLGDEVIQEAFSRYAD